MPKVPASSLGLVGQFEAAGLESAGDRLGEQHGGLAAFDEPGGLNRREDLRADQGHEQGHDRNGDEDLEEHAGAAETAGDSPSTEDQGTGRQRQTR